MNSNNSGIIIIGGFLTIVICAVIYAVIVLLSLLVANNPMNYRTFSSSEIAKEAFGLESGKKYPLQLGERIAGSGGEASASAGFFSASASVSLQPASSLSVAFHSGPKSYILELPMSKIVFLQRRNVPETIEISVDGYGHRADRYDEVHFNWIFLAGKHKPLQENSWFRRLKQNGKLGEFLQEGVIESVKVTLTPQNYNKILG